VQRHAPGVAGEVSGDVQNAVAQALGLAQLVLAVERQLLGVDEHVVSRERELEPGGVGAEGAEGQVRGASRLERLDAVLDLGVAAVGGLKRSDVGVVLVGDEALKTMPVMIGEGQLRPRVPALAPADEAGPGRPVLERDGVCQLGDPGALALLAVAVDSGSPGALGQGQDRLAQRLLDRIAEREADARLAAGPGEVVACAGGVRAREDLAVERLLGQLLERELKAAEVIVCVAALALPGLKIPASTSRPQVTSSGLKPKPPL
jgi:hypothetical protein